MLKAVAGLVIYPILGVAAAVHGIGIGFWWVLRHSYLLLAFPVATPSVARVWSARAKSDDGKIGPWFAGFMYFAGYALCSMITYSIVKEGPPPTSNLAAWLQDHWWVLFLPALTNLLSGLYEGGRAYFNWWQQKNSEKEMLEDARAVVAGRPRIEMVGDWAEMWERIQRMESMSDADAAALYKEIIDAVKNEKIDQREAFNLATAVHKARASAIRTEA